jgi:hypothetical protein
MLLYRVQQRQRLIRQTEEPDARASTGPSMTMRRRTGWS